VLAETLLPADAGEAIAVQCAGAEQPLSDLEDALRALTPFEGDIS
jgi:hypothetical protein